MSAIYVPVAEEIELLLVERAEVASSGPTLRILHRFRRPGTICLPGEEVAAASLVRRARRYAFRLSTAPLIFLDYLARHKDSPQTASQIEAGMRLDQFCQRHASNSQPKKARAFSKSSVKEYVKRLRMEFRRVFREAGLNLDPKKVLISEKTTSNQVRYKLRAFIIQDHEDLR